jgi:hypothetical protein
MTLLVFATRLGPAVDSANTPPPGWAVAVAIVLLVIVVVIAPLMVLQSLGNRRAGRLLEEWARANGLTLESRELEVFRWKGPFAFRGRWTSVFRIRGRSASGPVREGWVCMNNFFVWGGSPDVRWDG